MRIPAICNHNPATVVLAHLNGGGWGKKREDWEAAYACSDCHDAIDGRTRTQWGKDTLKLCHLEGVMRTQKILFEKGLLIVKNN